MSKSILTYLLITAIFASHKRIVNIFKAFTIHFMKQNKGQNTLNSRKQKRGMQSQKILFNNYSYCVSKNNVSSNQNYAKSSNYDNYVILEKKAICLNSC